MSPQADSMPEMNARMRRIDLFCKLMGPLTISLVAIASTEIAIYTTLGMNMASVLVEYVLIEHVCGLLSLPNPVSIVC